MEIIHIILTSTASVIALFLLTKLMGYRQMSQLSMFDYVNGITIGSIAAEMATALESDYTKPLTAMVVYTLFAILFSKLSEKSIWMRRIIIGKATVLYDKGTLYYKNMQKASLDLGEFLTQCRIRGYFDLDELQTAILEPNGQISFLPKAKHRPVTPEDVGLEPEIEMPTANVIIDGRIMYKNLKHTGRDEKWLMHQLKAFDITDVRDVFLATCNVHGQVCVYKKVTTIPEHDILN